MSAGVLIWLIALSAVLGVHIFMDWRLFARAKSTSEGFSKELTGLKEELGKLKEGPGKRE